MERPANNADVSLEVFLELGKVWTTRIGFGVDPNRIVGARGSHEMLWGCHCCHGATELPLEFGWGRKTGDSHSEGP